MEISPSLISKVVLCWMKLRPSIFHGTILACLCISGSPHHLRQIYKYPRCFEDGFAASSPHCYASFISLMYHHFYLATMRTRFAKLLHVQNAKRAMCPIRPTVQGLIIAIVLSGIWGLYITNSNLQLRAQFAKSSRNEEDLAISNANDDGVLYIYVSIAYLK